MKTTRLATLLAGVAGAMDAATGLGLVLLPGFTLRMMGVAAPTGDALVFLRWVGAFVGAVGASYLIALIRGGTMRLREVFVFTLVFRVAAGGYAAWAVASGALDWRWITVALTDGALVAV
ncbi:MAG: hypothetical protein MUE42_08095, partial [Opitutaceae bacterium]|nr:hypothetical protein [Opitutaceae bacterium]